MVESSKKAKEATRLRALTMSRVGDSKVTIDIDP